MRQVLNLQFPFYFSSNSSSLLEVKVCDQPSDTPLDRIFYWLYCGADSGDIQRLNFRAMKSNDTHQERLFAEAHLRFDSVHATLSWHDGRTDEVFQVTRSADMPLVLNRRIHAYLTSQRD